MKPTPCLPGHAHYWQLAAEPSDRAIGICIHCLEVKDVGAGRYPEYDTWDYKRRKVMADRLLAAWDKEHNEVTYG